MKDRISAFMDGELDDQAAGQVIDALTREREARETWRIYHLIGDALRDSRVLPAWQPALAAPGRPPSQPRARYAALAASLAAVALVGWLALAPPLGQQQTAVAPVAEQQPPVVAGKINPVRIPLPSGANDYLLAHQQFSPRVSLQGMAPYVRTVSEQVQESRK
jgi:sigma-E factor negative regulatory protein RseA